MGILLHVDDPGYLWVDFILPICDSSLDYLSAHCCHHQENMGGQQKLRKEVKALTIPSGLLLATLDKMA